MKDDRHSILFKAKCHGQIEAMADKRHISVDYLWKESYPTTLSEPQIPQ
jgi:hypothetical protein